MLRGLRKLKCKICGKEIKSQMGFLGHSRVHLKSKNKEQLTLEEVKK